MFRDLRDGTGDKERFLAHITNQIGNITTAKIFDWLSEQAQIPVACLHQTKQQS
jgi:hypothetical protein